MIYPEWAPITLVNYCEHITNGQNYNIDSLLEDKLETAFREIEENMCMLPRDERIELLNKLLTDLRMKKVWKSLDKRIINDNQYKRFWFNCERAIAGWRYSPKYTTSERRKHFKKIHDSAIALGDMLKVSEGFKYYSMNHLTSDIEIKMLLKALNANISVSNIDNYKDTNEDDISYARFELSEITPDIQEILLDISNKSEKYQNIELDVKKPNSSNADVQYFVRYLSSFLNHEYGQPLHEVVSITASVLLNKDVDENYVSHMV